MSFLKNISFMVLIPVAGIVSIVSAYNHPEISWKTVTTKHFKINYYDKTEPLVYPVWKIAEEAYETLAPLFGYTFVEKINISVADYEDYSNGGAMWTERNIEIWAPDAFFELRANNTWLRNVISHELSHILSMEKKKGMQLLDWYLAFDYQSPSANVTFTEPALFQTMVPMWFAEGAAQTGSEHMSSDCRDSRREMAIRCAALSGRLLTLDEMSVFTHDWIGNEMVYNQGYSFYRFLLNRAGPEKIASIWNACRTRKAGGKNFSELVKIYAGADLKELYGIWRDSLISGAKTAAPYSPTQTTAVYASGTLNARPRISRDNRMAAFFTNSGDDGQRTDLNVMDGSLKNSLTRIPYARTAWDFSADSRSVYYVKARKPDSSGSFFNELYRYDFESQTETRLVKSARIYELACSPSANHIACVRFEKGVFNLDVYDISKNSFETIVSGKAGDPFVNLYWHPLQEDMLAVSRLVNGKSDIFLLNLKDRSMTPLMSYPAQEESPFWAPDGRIYFSADYDGIFNIYSVKNDGTDLKRHTSVTGGAFSPIISTDNQLIFSEYTQSGFIISRCSPESAAFLAVADSGCAFLPLPEPKGKVTIDARSYSRTLLRPVWEIQSVVSLIDTGDAVLKNMQGTYNGNIQKELLSMFGTTLLMARSDALAKKSMYMGVSGVVMPMYMESQSYSSELSLRTPSLHTSSGPAGFSKKAVPYEQRFAERRQNAMIEAPLTSGINAGAAAAESESDDGDSVLFPIPALVPMFGVVNKAASATFGIDAQIALMLMIPEYILVQSYFEWQVGRDVFLGFSPALQLVPLYFLAGEGDAAAALSIPFWLTWSTYGYYNQDIMYNLAGISLLRVFAGPEVMPIDSTMSSELRNSEELVSSAAFISGGLEYLHGFSLTRYSSIIAGTSESIMYSATGIEDPVGKLSGESHVYANLGASANFVFPIVRNINKGRPYGDNLYGNVSYDIGMYTNRIFFRDFDFDDDSCIRMSHRFGAGMDLGFIKKYLFERRLSAGIGYEILNSEFSLSLKVM